MQKEKKKITSSKFMASDQALAEGQSTKVNYQDLAKTPRPKNQGHR